MFLSFDRRFAYPIDAITQILFWSFSRYQIDKKRYRSFKFLPVWVGSVTLALWCRHLWTCPLCKWLSILNCLINICPPLSPPFSAAVRFGICISCEPKAVASGGGGAFQEEQEDSLPQIPWSGRKAATLEGKRLFTAVNKFLTGSTIAREFRQLMVSGF